MRFRLASIPAALVLALSLAVPPAGADPFADSFGNAGVADDGHLADMRGRYATPDGIVNLGVEMYSQWRTNTGEVLKAGLELRVDLAHAAPEVRFRPSVSVEQAAAPAAGAPAPGAVRIVAGDGLEGARGIVQGIRVAGDGNRIDNGIGVQVTGDSLPARELPATASGTFLASGPDGSTATVNVGPDGLALRLSVPGQGEVLQAVGGSTLRQDARIAGDWHRIDSQMLIRAEIRPVAAARFDDALRSLRAAGLH